MYVLHEVFPGKGPIAPFFGLLHWTTVTEDPTFTDEAVFQKHVDSLNKYNVGYNAMWWNGEVRITAPLGQKVYHAGGSPGLNGDDNKVSFGIAIPYKSPSFNKRNIEGEVELPFIPRDENGNLLPERMAWYPPIDGDMLRQCAEACRTVFIEQGWTRASFYAHHMVNAPAKNDVRNLGVNTGGVDHAELNGIFTRPVS
jgi:hypothetical protein